MKIHAGQIWKFSDGQKDIVGRVLEVGEWISFRVIKNDIDRAYQVMRDDFGLEPAPGFIAKRRKSLVLEHWKRIK